MKIEAYNKFEAGMISLREEGNFIPDASTKEGYKASKAFAKKARSVEINIEEVRVKEKRKYIDAGKAVDSEAKILTSEISSVRLPHLEAFKAIDNAEKIAKEKRMTKAQEEIDAITCLIHKSEFAKSSEIADFIEITDSFDIDHLYELTGEGVMAKQRVMKTLTDMYTNKQQQEKDAAELEEWREKQQVQDQKDHDARIAKEASEKANKDKLEAIEREEKAQQDAIDAENRRVAQEKQFKINAEMQKELEIERVRIAKIEATKQAEMAAENARLKEVARQEAVDKFEVDRIAKLEADKKHTGNIRKQSKEDLMSLGVDEETAKKIVMAITKKVIRNISITY